MELVNAWPMPMWFPWAMLAVALWVTPWKGVALWKAARQQAAGLVCIVF